MSSATTSHSKEGAFNEWGNYIDKKSLQVGESWDKQPNQLQLRTDVWEKQNTKLVNTTLQVRE